MKVSEIELIYKVKVKACDRPKITSSLDAYDICKEKWSNQIGLQEEFNVILLDRSNKVMAWYNASKGGVAGTVADLKIIFAAAIKGRASALILAHNHPSGNLKPSNQDIQLTRKFEAAAEILDLKILDHLILSPEGGYYSFADEGMFMDHK